MKPGLSDISKELSKVVKEGNIYKKYSVVEEVVDLTPLKEELASLEALTAPDDKEVLELAKGGQVHPFYSVDKADQIERLKQAIINVEG